MNRVRTSRGLRAFLALAVFAVGCGSATGNVLESAADGPDAAGASSGASGEAASSSGGSAPDADASEAGSGTGGFGATETWNVVVGDLTGTIVITDTTVDVQLGKYTLAVVLVGESELTMDQTTTGGETQRYVGTRTAGPPLDLGVTPLSLAGAWSLTSARRTLSANLDADAAHVQCEGACQFYAFETVDVTRTSAQPGPTFGVAHGQWDAIAHETPAGGASVVRIEDNRIDIGIGAVSFAAAWSGNTMSGTYEVTSEFAAERQ